MRGPNDLERAFRAAADGGAEALIVVGVSFFIPHRQRIVNLEIKHRLPTMHTHPKQMPLGGLISYTTDSRTLGITIPPSIVLRADMAIE